MTVIVHIDNIIVHIAQLEEIFVLAWFCSLNVSFQNSLTLQMSFHISLTLQMFPELSSLVLSGEKRNCSSASFNNFSFALKDRSAYS